MSESEAAIEKEIQDKGLNAPRLTPALIDAAIKSEDYHIFPGTTLTVCALTLQNGFFVTGESAAASPANFDVELGRKMLETKSGLSRGICSVSVCSKLRKRHRCTKALA